MGVVELLVAGIGVLNLCIGKKTLLYAGQKQHFTIFFYQVLPAGPEVPSTILGNNYSNEFSFKYYLPFSIIFSIVPLLVF